MADEKMEKIQHVVVSRKGTCGLVKRRCPAMLFICDDITRSGRNVLFVELTRA